MPYECSTLYNIAEIKYVSKIFMKYCLQYAFMYHSGNFFNMCLDMILFLGIQRKIKKCINKFTYSYEL